MEPIAVEKLARLNGALLINKHPGVTSFGVIELLQKQLVASTGVKRRDLPKLGHGGTLDPFATGLLVVCVGNAVKLARYFLGSTKGYRGLIRFGETTVPGDPTEPVSEKSDVLPESLEQLRQMATKFSAQPYLQTPPMHSAKKKDGKPLYELAREGLEVDREPKLCHLYEFDVRSYDKPRAEISVLCSSGTYIRTLAQDFGRLLGTVAMLESLERTRAGAFTLDGAMRVEEIARAETSWDQLPCWIPFDRLLEGNERAQATEEEATALSQGRQNVLFNILRRTEPALSRVGTSQDVVAIYQGNRLVAVTRKENGIWGIERVFPRSN